MEDSLIFDLYFKRSERALIETQDKYGRMLRALAFGILRSMEDAGECENDTYMKTWNVIPPTRPNVFSAFLARITRNLALDHYARSHAQKRGGGAVPLLLDELAECLPCGGSGAETDDSALHELLDRFLASLRKEARVIFMRRYWFGDSITEITGKLGCKEGTIRTSLMRTRRALKRTLEQEGYSI